MSKEVLKSLLEIIETKTGKSYSDHTNKLMTEKYAKKIKGLYRQQIIVNSPDF